jgi:hypothetical protein
MTASWMNNVARSETVRQELLHDFRIGFGQNHCPACVTNEFVRTFDHAMAFASGGGFDFASPGYLEPFLGSRFGLHLGHFATPDFYEALAISRKWRPPDLTSGRPKPESM